MMLEVLAATVEGGRLLQLGAYSLSEMIARQNDPLPVEIIQEGKPRRVFEAQLRAAGEDTGQWLVMLREVTQERDNQARIQMQERLATVGQLAAGIAHDFNNIMAAILVYTDLLITDPHLNPESHERLTIIQKQVQRAASLIRQILDFSRRAVMEQSSLDLLPFVKELDKMLQRVLPETIRLELAYQPGEYTVQADPTRLQQVFINLALNARDAMPQGGSLRFALDRYHLANDQIAPIPDMTPGEWIRIRVSDEGTGISPEALPHIFEPFFTTKPVGEGTGLGLAQVYGIIRQHNGYIDVSSQLGEGTEFVIYLPLLPGAENEPQATGSASRFDGSGKTVLVVEDDPATLGAMQALLASHNYEVLTASHGAEALEIFKQQPEISLVVSDIVMPQMGGVALFEALSSRWADVKMLFVTGHPLGDESQNLLERGDVHWLQKPFSVQEFLEVVQEIIP